MRWLAALVLAALTYGWTLAVYTYADAEVYNGSLQLASLKPMQFWTFVAPGGWPLYIKSGGQTIPVELHSDLFVVVGRPADGCDVFLFYSIALDSTAVIAICAEETFAVVSAGGGRREWRLEAGVNYMQLPGRAPLDVVASSRPVRIRSSHVATAYPPAVMAGVPTRGGPLWNASALLGRIYNLTRELDAARESCARQIEALRREVAALRSQVETLRKENESLRVVGPQSLALYASIAVGLAAAAVAIYVSKRRGKQVVKLKSGNK